MDDAEDVAVVALELVREAEAVERLHRDIERFLHAESPSGLTVDLDDRLQVTAVDELHHDEERVVGGTDVEDGDDVRVRQTSAEARLVEEHRDEVLVLREVRQNALDRDDLLEALDGRGLALEHFGHTARFEALDDSVSLFGGHSLDSASR